jgi:hypothetical protein
MRSKGGRDDFHVLPRRPIQALVWDDVEVVPTGEKENWRNIFELESGWGRLPKVARPRGRGRASQPWAEGCNPVGGCYEIKMVDPRFYRVGIDVARFARSNESQDFFATKCSKTLIHRHIATLHGYPSRHTFSQTSLNQPFSCGSIGGTSTYISFRNTLLWD